MVQVQEIRISGLAQPLFYQDELVQLQRDIDYKNGEVLIEQRTRLQVLTKEYCKSWRSNLLMLKYLHTRCVNLLATPKRLSDCTILFWLS